MSPFPRVAVGLLVLALLLSFLALHPPLAASGAVSVRAVGGRGWTNVTASPSPPGVGGGMMAYDSNADRFVAFGGSDGDPTNGTWVFDPSGATWTQLQPAVSPPARVDGALAFDSRADAFILFGGWQEPADEVYVRLNDTWAFYLANETWIPRPAAHGPEARSDAAISYDPREDFLLLEGGFNGTAYLADAWRYEFNASEWMPVAGAVMPSKRADGRMVYDPRTAAFYLFGGNDFSGPNFSFHHLNDTWRFDPVGQTWTRLFPAHSPGARDYAVFAADTAAGELLSMGGFGNGTVLGELWAFNTTQLDWRNLTAPEGPSPRMAAVGGYSPVENVFVVFSGGDKVSVKNDTWVYRFPGPLMGTVTASTVHPDPGAAVTFQGALFGGSGVYRHERWSFGDGANATGLEASHAFASPGVYTVRFQAADDMGDTLNLTLQVTAGGSALVVVAITALVGAAAIVGVVAYRRSRKGKGPPPTPP